MVLLPNYMELSIYGSSINFNIESHQYTHAQDTNIARRNPQKFWKTIVQSQRHHICETATILCIVS